MLCNTPIYPPQHPSSKSETKASFLVERSHPERVMMKPPSLDRDMSEEGSTNSSETNSGDERWSLDAGKQVRFASRVKVLDVPTLAEIGNVTKQTYWYSRRDIDSFYADREAAMNSMVSFLPVGGGDQLCFLGLQTRRQLETLKVRRTKAIHNVLREQSLQWEEDCEDPEFIAEICSECSRSSQTQALQRGQSLARELAQLENARPHEKMQHKFEPVEPVVHFRRLSLMAPLESPGSLDVSTVSSTYHASAIRDALNIALERELE